MCEGIHKLSSMLCLFFSLSDFLIEIASLSRALKIRHGIGIPRVGVPSGIVAVRYGK